MEKLEFDMVKKKIKKVRNRRYITSGIFLSLKTFFHVPKVDSEIILLYDLTYCGLNEALWDPKLWMTSVENFLDTATHYSWFVDVESAEMFHDYKLS